MSTIFEALKKSEQERKLSKLPELSSMPLPEEDDDSTRIWLGFAILAALVIAIIVYLVVSSNEQATDSAVEQQSIPQYTAPSQQVVSEYIPGSRVYDYAELSGRTRQVADSLNVNVVSYTQDLEKRFVMIDSNMYRVGNTVSLQNSEQVEVLDIEENAVVLRYEETQFRLLP